MEKLEKVIAGLSGCIVCNCSNCEYFDPDNEAACTERLMVDALEWLKSLSDDLTGAHEEIHKLVKNLKVARAERDSERARITRLIGMVHKEWLEKVHPDWYSRLEELDYNYDPVKDGEPWYRAEDVWACIEEIPDDHREFGAHMDEEVAYV